LNLAKADIARILCLDLFGPAIVKCFGQCGLRVFPHFESGCVPDQRYEHQRNDAEVERDDSDSFKFVLAVHGFGHVPPLFVIFGYSALMPAS
jgi:hypothetical protein